MIVFKERCPFEHENLTVQATYGYSVKVMKMSTGKPTAPAHKTYTVAAAALLALILLFLSVVMLPQKAGAEKRVVHLSVLMAGNFRKVAVDGLREGLATHAIEENISFTIEVISSNGDRGKLTGLARQIIDSRPTIAIAAGGIEADALLEASKGTNVPVVFLSVSSSIERGLAASMSSSGNNLTGIDTNDTKLTAKRIWFIKKLFPQAKKITCFHVPSIAPSLQSVAVARESVKELGFSLNILSVETEQDIIDAASSINRDNTDIILLLPAAPTDKALLPIIFPRARELAIPVFGYGRTSMESGAVVSYAGSRYENGRQAARLVHKIINGVKPGDIPIEPPEKLELIINRHLAEELGISFPERVWRMTDQILDIQF